MAQSSLLFFKRLSLIFLLFAYPFTYAQDSINLFHLSQAQKLISNSTLPPDFTKATSVSLPNHWQHDVDKFYGSVWYKIKFEPAIAVKQQWGIYLPEVNMNAEVWLNDIKLGSGGRMQAPISRYWHSPLMFVFSPSDLKKSNYFYIRVVAYANQFGQLGDLRVGERNHIERLYSNSLFNTVTIHIISGILAAVYALFMALVWYKRKDSLFFWGALLCATWSISSLNLYITNPVISELWWEKLMQISMGWVSLFFFFFIRRINKHIYHAKFEGGILWVALLMSLSILFSSENQLFFLSKSFHLYAMIWGLFSVFSVIYFGFKDRQPSHFVMIIAIALIAISGVHDVMVQNKVIESGQAFWLDYSIPIILLMIGYLMVTRFLQAVQVAEQLNKDLESRVQKAQHKIEADYEKILTLETEQASNNERERIYRNLHDDMGAKLLSLVYKADNDEMSNLARSAMADLRSIVSKKPSQKYLLTKLLDSWYKTTIKRCLDANIHVEWQQQNISKKRLLSSHSYEHLMRIQTESISNIIKHSQCQRIQVMVQLRFNCLYIKITDDGIYSDITQWQDGRGLNNMRFRIAQLNGKIHWQANHNSGGHVRWIIPINQ